MAKITGIGGVFLKSSGDGTALASWYQKHLGVVLEEGRVEIVKGPETHENGKFAWILDPDGNKVELWEPKAWDEANKESAV